MSTQTAPFQSPVHFDKIGQIAIAVRDLGRAKDFYQNVLGMRLLFDAGGMAFFQCGDIRLMLGSSDAPVLSGSVMLYFLVPDIHKVYAVLSEQHIEFVQGPQLIAKMPDHDLWIAFLKDPDGNTLGMMSEVRHG